jgi:uncharacterized phage protein gp47/JayE
MKQPCGCCSGVEVITPEPEANRPGLTALAYRAGTHESFLESMIARLSTLYLDIPASDGSGNYLRIRPVNGLRTRESDDPSIALLDAWATVADVLTFYQERIANEGYLRTATERLSILELARLIGYRLRPAVSASVYLAFTAADGFEGTIPAGTRAQSIPGAGEKPQFFESSDDLPARDVWNNLKPRLTRPQTFTIDTNPGTDLKTRETVYFQGIATNLNPGDALLLVLGDGENQQQLRRIHSVETQTEQQRTEVTLEEDPIEIITGQSPFTTVDLVLKPFIEEGTTIFANTDLAALVVAALNELLDNLKTITSEPGNPEEKQAAAMVEAVIPQIQNSLDVAKRRKFTRLKPWLIDLLEALKIVVRQLAKITLKGSDNSSQNIRLHRTGLLTSPLDNLLQIITPLALPPSLQPANALRLSRTVAATFARQADVAPRILAAFHPEVGTALYKAWSGVETPISQIMASAPRAKAGLFASSFAGKSTLTQVKTTSNNAETTTSTVSFAPPTLNSAWSALFDNENNPPTAVALDSTYDRIAAGTWVAIDRPPLRIQNQLSRKITYHQIISTRVQTMDAGGGFTAKVTLLTLDPPWLSDLTTTADLNAALRDNAVLRGTVVYAQSEELELAEEPLDTDVEGNKIELDELYNGLDAGRWIIVSGERTDIPNTTGVKAAELVMVAGVAQGARSLFCVDFPLNFIPFSQWAYTTDANQYGDRLVVGYITKDNLKTVQESITELVSGDSEVEGDTFNQQFCDQVQLAPGVYANAYVPTAAELNGNFKDFTGLLVDPQSGKPIAGGRLFLGQTIAGVPATATDPLLFAWRISTQPVHTVLTLANNLAYKYDPTTVTIYGNVVKATHGQTTGEVLGNGDASQPLQTFALHQSPLTYLSAPTPSGAESTLEVRVNEIQWHEADNLAFLGPTDRKFITQTGDDDQVAVIFGNGEHGSRVPSGVANVKAVYRYGCGKAGNVQAEQISQLSSQPLGVKSVINPLRASGGADHDTRDQARRNAPLAVMALDRLISVRDYADFARTFAGIGKAAAARLSDGHTLLVHLTIAGKDDIPIDQNSDLYRNLFEALEQSGDPQQPLRVQTRRLKLLVINAGVKVLPDYQWESVGPNVKAALLDFYSFDRRELGQSAFLSEAVAVMQAVPGVQYVDMRVFDSVAENVTAAQLAGLAVTLQSLPYVVAEMATPDPSATDPAKSILPAELVMLTPDVPDTLTLTEITV